MTFVRCTTCNKPVITRRYTQYVLCPWCVTPVELPEVEDIKNYELFQWNHSEMKGC
jgi:uncharacterized CHY-type Zn-finger protein